MQKQIISVELSNQEAWDLAQFLKRATFSDFRACAVDDDEAYRMIQAADRLRVALAESGHSPR